MATRILKAEFMNLKKEFIGLKNLIQNFLDKHGDLERKYENFLLKKRKPNIKCRICCDKFQILGQFQKHKVSRVVKESVKYVSAKFIKSFKGVSRIFH